MALDYHAAAVADLQRTLELTSSSKDVVGRLRAAQASLRTQGSAGPNYYLLLGLQPHASAADVKAAYK